MQLWFPVRSWDHERQRCTHHVLHSLPCAAATLISHNFCFDQFVVRILSAMEFRSYCSYFLIVSISTFGVRIVRVVPIFMFPFAFQMIQRIAQENVAASGGCMEPCIRKAIRILNTSDFPSCSATENVRVFPDHHPFPCQSTLPDLFC